MSARKGTDLALVESALSHHDCRQTRTLSGRLAQLDRLLVEAAIRAGASPCDMGCRSDDPCRDVADAEALPAWADSGGPMQVCESHAAELRDGGWRVSHYDGRELNMDGEWVLDLDVEAAQ